MNRRGFFGRMIGALIGSVVATKIAPKTVSLDWQTLNVPAPSDVIHYIASDGPSVFMGVFQPPSMSGTQTIAGVPFSPTSVLFYRQRPTGYVSSFTDDGFTLDWPRV